MLKIREMFTRGMDLFYVRNIDYNTLKLKHNKLPEFCADHQSGIVSINKINTELIMSSAIMQ